MERDRENVKEKVDIEKLRQTVFDIIWDRADIDAGIQEAIAVVGETLHISRVYIFENNEENTHSNNTFEWCGEGIEPQIDSLQNMSFGVCL
ncbi:MAG: hypothetical protein EOM34_14445 [Clostridia bacterium]|nr:hypothetical protein [Clostridia bacterium]NCD03758.1 hypothetical protein [Clostridia bacterium]